MHDKYNSIRSYLSLILRHELRQKSVDLLRISIDVVYRVTNDLAESVRDLSTRKSLRASQSIGLVEVRVRIQQNFRSGSSDIFNGYRAVSATA